MSFLLFNAILLIIVFILLIILSWIWPPDSPWAPWWKTSKETARDACRLAGINSRDVVYELGSGDGTFLLTAAREFGAKGIGIEIDLLRYFIAALTIRIIRAQNKVRIKRKNFFDEDISLATVLFVYLVPKTLNRLKPKFLKELKKGTRIVSYRYKMDLPFVKEDSKNRLYLYKI